MKELVHKTFRIKKERGWNTVYIAVDVHDSIVEANYQANNIPTKFFPHAKETLQKLSKRDDVVLILFTCSHPHEIKQYLEYFEGHGIHFKYCNENPETPNTSFGCFDRKFYFNILIEDKASFCPEKHWLEISEALDEVDKLNS